MKTATVRTDDRLAKRIASAASGGRCDRFRRRATRVIAAAFAARDPLMVDGRLARWYIGQHRGEQAAFATYNPNEAVRVLPLLRGLLILDGTLHSPAAVVDGVELLVGEQILAGKPTPSQHAAGVGWPSDGVPGTITGIDANRAVAIDFATHGRCMLHLPATRCPVRYAYVADLVADAAVG